MGMAIGDTFEQLGLAALLQRKNYWREKLRKFHEPYGNIADLFAWEKLTWDILRKVGSRPHGLARARTDPCAAFE